MRIRLAACTVGSAIVALASGDGALAFGTTHALGQNAEHERITRNAFGCPGAGAACLQPKTLDEFAGASGSFGAIGAPDRGSLIFQHKAHCDSGDHLDLAGYAQSAQKARANLEDCRAWMGAKLGEAVADAAGLLDRQGKVRGDQAGLGCVFVGGFKGRAKCNVLEDFGVLLHASQDFYSHTNWVDRPDPARPIGPANPPGLGKTGAAPWISLRADTPFPAGLMSGCFVSLPESRFCNEGPGGRVKHAALNKDEGAIDPAIGAGVTDRGKVQDNFRRAVEAAIADSRDKWDLLRQRLVSTYGAAKGAAMACTLSRDDPAKDC